MNLHRNDVCARTQECSADDVGEKIRAIIRRGRGGQGQVADGAGRHVLARHLRAVEINDAAIVALEADGQRHEHRRIGDHERAPEIGRDESVVRIRSEAHHRRLIAVPIAQLGRAAGPSPIVEIRPDPVRAKVRARVQILPNSSCGNERDRRFAAGRQHGAKQERNAHQPKGWHIEICGYNTARMGIG